MTSSVGTLAQATQQATAPPHDTLPDRRRQGGAAHELHEPRLRKLGVQDPVMRTKEVLGGPIDNARSGRQDGHPPIRAYCNFDYVPTEWPSDPLITSHEAVSYTHLTLPTKA